MKGTEKASKKIEKSFTDKTPIKIKALFYKDYHDLTGTIVAYKGYVAAVDTVNTQITLMTNKGKVKIDVETIIAVDYVK